ncbi:glycosyltransferase [Microbacterium sp. zg.Y909]|uniref:glycosyltransferase n=1 Tax=Microbacterium sp. zg.Y909 TaxID=2969413 RepID=UPI00214C10E1|nr:glycosyltransferase [Microbacterium sp. zg.Y909]MCR2824013.1 glycosyltransferase [Microbacterium sp. zg.Y909]
MPSVADIAIIVTVHHEGRFLVPTLRSLGRCIVEAAPARVEVVIVGDRIDEATRSAVDQALRSGALSAAERVEVIDVDHGDLSLARNDGIARSQASAVGVLDADNLPSGNWLAHAHALLSAQDVPSVVHPELVVTFGAKREVWPLISSVSPQFQRGWLAWFNPWDAFVLADRRVFERYPYRPSPPGGGFGPEDWAWNCDTLAGDVPHVVAAGTTLFYRASPHGLAAAHHASLLPRNELLSSRAVAVEALQRIGASAAAPGRPARRRHPVGRALSLARRTAAYLARPVRERLRRPAPPVAIADDLAARRDDWSKAHELQPEIPFPSDDTLRGYGRWGTDWGTTFLPEQRAYWSAIAALPEQIDVLFIAPWLRTGGADLLTAQYIAAVRRTRPDATVALITTEPEPSTRLGALEGVTVFELGRFELLPQFGVRVLGQIIAQRRPGTVHVVNSTLGFDVVDVFGAPLAQHSDLFVSTYVLDRLPDGTMWSFLHHRSRDFYRHLAGVLTDNAKLVRHMASAEGAPEDAFVVHPAAVQEPDLGLRARPLTADAPLRVVWAGRFDRQKRLDRLVPIAEALRGLPVEFHVYGDAVIGDDPALTSTLDRLRSIGAVLHPPYTSGFAEMAREGGEVLLLTSDREGLPNTVLEAMSSGMPVVAPDVGDIARVVTTATGFLVGDPEDTSGYVAALTRIVEDFPEALARARRGRERVMADFSAARLDATLEALPGYLPRAEGGRAAAHHWYTDDATRRLLESGDPVTLVYTGSNGHSNFGDILQNKNILDYWTQRPDRTPVLFLPAFAGDPGERVASLRRWFDCPHIVLFSDRRRDAPKGLREIRPPVTGAPLHVVGGGYLNAMWGSEHFSAIDAIATDLGASQVVFTGLQVDDAALSGFRRLAERHRVPFIGLRDSTSLARVSKGLDIPAVDTFDDLTEVLEDWAGPSAVRPRSPDGGLRVAVHMNTSGYAGGEEALSVWREALESVAQLGPDEVYLLNAYADARSEVQDTLRTMAALAEDFPFGRVTVIDLAGAALGYTAGSGLPPVLEPLRTVDFALSSSYHTALMMTFLGVPTYLMGANAYFGQKAELFRLPPLADFLTDPAASLPDLSAQRLRRRAWVAELDEMTFEAPASGDADSSAAP